MNAKVLKFPGGDAPGTPRAKGEGGQEPRLLHSWNIFLMGDGTLKAVLDHTDKAHMDAAPENARDALLEFIGETECALCNAAAEAEMFGGGDGGGEGA